jgi:hypothetical protein
MGNGVISCCEASSSMQDEMTVISPRTITSPAGRLILNEVSQFRYQSSPEYQETLKRVNALKSLRISSSLIIKVINSGPLAKDSRFEISYLGLQGSKRSSTDGKVFFGSKRKEFGKVVNDVVIPLNNSANNKEQHRGKHFEIVYNIEKDRFFIRDLGKDFGVYMRISFPVKVKNGMKVNIGSTFLTLNVEDGKNPHLFIKDATGEERVFDCCFADDQEISLGRGISCGVRFDDTLLSKVHALICFNQDHWVLTDGDGEKSSTNGTWLYLSEETLMFDSMIFKSNQCVFQVVSSSNTSEIIN